MSKPRGTPNGRPTNPPACANCGREIYATPYETKAGHGWIHTTTNREQCRTTPTPTYAQPERLH